MGLPENYQESPLILLQLKHYVFFAIFQAIINTYKIFQILTQIEKYTHLLAQESVAYLCADPLVMVCTPRTANILLSSIPLWKDATSLYSVHSFSPPHRNPFDGILAYAY